MRSQSLWCTLFAAYSDGEEHMSLQALQQFCKDFRLIPEITSWHYLRSCYRTSQAAETRMGHCPGGSKASTMSTPDGEASVELPGRRRPLASARKKGPQLPPQGRQRSASIQSTSSLLD
eukprot:4496997-Amphidinium_carterae.1